MRQAKGFRDAGALLLGAGTCPGPERVAVMGDLVRAEAPTDADGNQLSPPLGWADAFTERWQARGYSLHSPAALPARVEALPFLSSIHDHKPPELEDWAQRRSMIREPEQIGMPEPIVMPVHRPLARVGIIFWLGQGPAGRLSELVAERELARIGKPSD